ncbi:MULTISPECIES: FtsX-like permease family protein [unclassified Marinobacter]|uniref:FtsX-like permease family protein n=1 Tax=unclassified Marinobacter TaxID=83889 RepID=UPI001928C55C|nr:MULTISPECIES: FtsX-like permease family protein [unclassified Marinobacter]MBL3823885.1 FtsX-like permease family protein [Marinobacter sp. MC3]MBL3892041.1 FtsX-like permease family protein [Marinobacter sp. MW3]
MTLLAALFSHYRRHPLQLLALAVMIVLATMLWTGVHHLTSQARASLDQSKSAVAERQQVVRRDGNPVTVDDFVELRRAGLCVMPWLEVSSPEGGRVVGVDPLAVVCFQVPGRQEAPWGGELDGRPFVDISEAAELDRDQGSELSLLISEDHSSGDLPSGYQMVPFSVGPDTGELSDSFLLNLDALGVLVLLITALLVRSVYLLGLAQRRDSLALLHRFGVPQGRVNRLLVVEILMLALVCVVPGIWLGRWLATGLGSGFGQALEGLFDQPLYAGQGGSWLVPLVIMMAVVLVACLADFLRPLARGLAGGNRRSGGLVLLVLLAGLALSVWVTDLLWLFIAVAMVFVAAGILAPRLIAWLADWRSGHDRDPQARWRHRELSVLARRLALPLVALQFAMAMVLAVQALVTTFESTFDRWLSQRLEADYYIEVPESADPTLAVDWLADQPVLAASGLWHRVIRGRATLLGGKDEGDARVDVFAIGPVGSLVTGWQLFESAPRPWQSLQQGQGVMVNEQLARRQDVKVGQTLQVTLASQSFEFPVLAIYPDYGRPAGEILIHPSVLPADFAAGFQSLSISPGNLSIEDVIDGLQRVWQVEALTIRDNRAIEELASAIFDQTFLLTRAMTTLTLVLAAIALLMMGWVFFSTRAWYFRLLVVWGLSRRQASAQLIRLSVSLTGAVTLLALPLGVWLTWVLVHRINPIAFGWSLPMAVYPRFWLELGVLSLLIGLSIALLMSRQLKSPTVAPVNANAMAGGER